MLKKTIFQRKQVIASLVLFFAASAIFTFRDYYTARKTVLEQSQAHAERVAMYLSSILVANEEENYFTTYHLYEEHDNQIRDILESFGVVNVKIFDVTGTILFSLEPDVVGRIVHDNLGLTSALSGVSRSHVANLSYLFRIYGAHADFPMMETYVPIRNKPAGKIFGAYEIYQDYRPLGLYVRSETVRSSVTHMLLLVIFFLFIYRFGRLASRLLEEQHIAMIRNLEGRVNDRTSELRLSESRVKSLLERTEEMYRKLKISDEYKKNFMSLIGHELRTPLTVIEGYLSLFADGTMKSGDEHGKAALATSIDEARNLETTIENIIELSQLDEGIREVSLEKFDVRSLLKDAVTNLEDEIEKVGTMVSIDVDENISTFTSDRMKVHQIINQLLSNAIKFSGSNGNVLLSASDGTEGIILAVGDEGIGIPPEQLQNIFDRFYQVDISSTRSYEGSGLGLAIVKEITDVLGGKVWVESVEGSGSTFFVEIPGLDK